MQESSLRRTNVQRCLALAVALGLAAAVTLPARAQAAEDSFKVGLVTFLSGGAAGPFGVPAKNAGDLIIAALNDGAMVAPYDMRGFNGLTIEPVVIDEAGGATKQVAEFRNLVQRQGVDAVIGYISSGDCLAIGPVAEELQTLTVFFDCGTPRVFEEADYKYVFRTGPSATMDNVGAARYVLYLASDVEIVSGINQNYAWGHDSWSDFIESMKQLQPGIEVATAQFPKIYAGQYGAEISALSVNAAEFIHSSFWGGDLEGFVLQGSIRGLFEDQVPVLTAGETAMFRLAEHFAEGTVLGGRGPFGIYAPESDLNTWFRDHYIEAYGTPPTYPSYKMAQAILGLKLAIEAAAVETGDAKPETEAIIAAFEGLTYTGPAGLVEMVNGNGHQAIMEMVYGQFTMANGEPAAKNIKRYPAHCVNPPPGMTAQDWIAAGFSGAACD